MRRCGIRPRKGKEEEGPKRRRKTIDHVRIKERMKRGNEWRENESSIYESTAPDALINYACHETQPQSFHLIALGNQRKSKSIFMTLPDSE